MSSRGRPLRYLAKNKILTNDAHAAFFIDFLSFFKWRKKNLITQSIIFRTQTDYYREISLCIHYKK